MRRAALIAFVVFVLAAVAPAQDRPRMVTVDINGVKSTVPEHMAIEYIERQTRASGTGAGYEGDPEAAKSFSSQAPDLSQSSDGDVAVIGGVTTFAGRKVSGQSAVLYIFGALCIIGGVAVWVLTKRADWGGIGVGSGIVLIMCGIVADHYPWAALVGVFLVVAVGAGWLVYKIKTNGVPQVEADAIKAKYAGLSESLAREFETMIDDAKQRAMTAMDPVQIAEWTAYADELRTRLTRIVK